ncbi:uncharacterized protein LOC122919773 [Bufo gargarizans]|uniref:uncharacterized protein LOC122919773 n=1 Tax=Bufo gargarizans TaxID=30331 RepID=UPI001CF1DBF2|nr:uncharacterized protein LOC122919773 [Bufo gargarizans]
MTSWSLSLASALLCFLVSVAVGEPSCEGVEDFGRCAGDKGDFCPRDIDCSCKSGRPFCSCPFYTGPNGNYWYLGEKCDHLWSTLDMIVIAVFPAAALAFVVAVTAQLIHFCKTKPKSKKVKEPKRKSEREAIITHQNQAFIPEASPGNQYTEQSLGDFLTKSQPKAETSQWNAPAAKAPKPYGLKYYSDMAPADQSSSYIDGRQQPQYNDQRVPEQDYPSYEPRGQQQYSRFSGAMIPPADYQDKGPELSSPNAGWTNRPYSFGRPQVRSGYDY